MALLWVQEKFTIVVGDTGPDNNKSHNLESLRVPEFEEITQDFFPGGAIGQIGIGGLGLKKLQISFKSKGWDPQTLSQFGVPNNSSLPYTIYGVVRDKSGEAAKELKCVARAKMIKITADDMRNGDLFGFDYMLDQVRHYELYLDKREKFYYDWFSTEWRVDGVVQNADDLAILRINTGA